VCTVTEDDIRKSAPHVVSASFKSIRSEVLLNALSDKGIYVSSGSACSSNRPELSGTLQAIGVEKALLDSTLRFSFSKETCEEDIRELIKALHDLLPVLRQFTVH
jgi:cysteine desulfurase